MRATGQPQQVHSTSLYYSLVASPKAVVVPSSSSAYSECLRTRFGPGVAGESMSTTHRANWMVVELGSAVKLTRHVRLGSQRVTKQAR